MFRGIEIGFAGAEVNHVEALGSHAFGTGIDGESSGRGEVKSAFGVIEGHDDCSFGLG
jgi:hypothetical protein